MLREMVLMFDSSTIRWSDSMALGAENVPGTSEAVPMEIDRIQQKGKGKGGKGKSSKGSPKGQSKGKSKGKDSKGKSKGNDSKGSTRDMLVVDQREKEKGGSATIVARQGI